MGFITLFVFLLFACIVTSEQWFYRVGSGPVFGPFTSQELVKWSDVGYFKDQDIRVARSKFSNQFMPISSILNSDIDAKYNTAKNFFGIVTSSIRQPRSNGVLGKIIDFKFPSRHRSAAGTEMSKPDILL